MKKFLSVALTLILMLTISACSESEKNEKADSKNALSDTTAPIKEEVLEEVATESYTEDSAEGTTTGHCTEESATAKEEDKVSSVTQKSEQTTKNQAVTTKKPVSTTKKPVSTTKKSETTTKKPQTTASPSKKLPAYSPEAEIVTLFNTVNNYRVENGLKKLTLDPELCKMAYVRAKEQDYATGHTRPDGTEYYAILDEYNYDYMGCGENISFFWNVSASESFDNWKNSPTHNQNMLESRWTKSGIALHKNANGSYSIVHLFVC